MKIDGGGYACRRYDVKICIAYTALTSTYYAVKTLSNRSSAVPAHLHDTRDASPEVLKIRH